MNDFCDCSQCPHHCGRSEDADTPVDGNNEETTTSESNKSNEGEAFDDEDTTASAIEKVDHLKKDIIELGFKLEDTEDGIRVTM